MFTSHRRDGEKHSRRLSGPRHMSLFTRLPLTAYSHYRGTPASVRREEEKEAARDAQRRILVRELEAAAAEARAVGIDLKDSPQYKAAVRALREHDRSGNLEVAAASVKAVGIGLKWYIVAMVVVIGAGLMIVVGGIGFVMMTWVPVAVLAAGFILQWLRPVPGAPWDLEAPRPSLRGYLRELKAMAITGGRLDLSRREGHPLIIAGVLAVVALALTFLSIQGHWPLDPVIPLLNIGAGVVLWRAVRTHRATKPASGRQAGRRTSTDLTWEG